MKRDLHVSIAEKFVLLTVFTREGGGGRSNPHLPNSEHFWALCVPERRVMKNKIPKKLYFSEAIVPFILDIHRQNLDIQNLGHSEIL